VSNFAQTESIQERIVRFAPHEPRAGIFERLIMKTKSLGPLALVPLSGMRVLLIEDDSATAQSIELMLKSESFNVFTTDLGKEGVDLGTLYAYDIIVLDLNLPDMSGFDVLRSLRVSKVKTPILILSGNAGMENIKGLGLGADDYMTKPFHRDELLARIHAIVRRSQGHAESVVQIGDLVVNLDAKTVEINHVRVHLTVKEYQMLEFLGQRPHPVIREAFPHFGRKQKAEATRMAEEFVRGPCHRNGLGIAHPCPHLLGSFKAGRQSQNLAFSGPGKQTLYMTAREGLYRVRMLSKGPDRLGK
jgi:two-component system cell cycle response regulator CtrA